MALPGGTTAVRNWLQTLWQASYNGFPFWFDRYESEGGLGIVTHIFPNSDQPFNEDLGENPRYFSGSAYIFGDDVDTQTAAFEAVLVIHGPGILVLPMHGTHLVRLLTFKRVFEKDRLGYIAFDLKFVAEGFPLALISVPFLGQTAIDFAFALGTAIAIAAPAILAVADQPEYVAAAAASEIVAAMAAVDVLRTSYPVAPAAAAAVAAQIQAITLAAPLLLDPAGPNVSDVANLNAAMAATVPAVLAANFAAPTTPNPTLPVNAGVKALTLAVVASIVTLGAGMAPPIATDAMAALVDLYAPASPAAQSAIAAALAANAATAALSPNAVNAAIAADGVLQTISVYGASNAAALASISAALSANAATAAQNVISAQQLVRLAALTAWATAIVNTTYSDRPQGVTARAEAAERFEIELNNCPGAAYARLYVAIEQLQGSVVNFLTQNINNLAPVVTVEANAQLPSLVWAWKLYQDPTRCVDLVLRNSVTNPSFMPRTFAALAPGYAASGLPTNWPAPPL